MGDTVGSLSVELGLDLAKFEDSCKQVPAITSRHFDRMSAEMKRTSREGAESLRIIDEALGIHLSRPVTRVINEELPGLAAALQDVLGGAVVGAIAMAGVALFEKLGSEIDEATRKQEALRETTLKLGETYSEFAVSSWEKTEKLTAEIAKLQGNAGLAELKEQALAYAAAMKSAQSEADKLYEAVEKQQKAAVDASDWWNSILTEMSATWHQFFSLQSTLDVESLQIQLAAMKVRVDQAFEWDKLHATHTALQELNEDIRMASLAITAMGKQGNEAGMQVARGALAMFQTMKEGIANAEAIKALEDQRVSAQAAAKASTEAAEKLKGFYKELTASSKHLLPETDAVKKVEEEIGSLRDKAVADFMEISRSATSALDVSRALVVLNQYEKKLAEVLQNARLAAAEKALPSALSMGGAGALNLPEAAPMMPTLEAGGTAAAELAKFEGDVAAQTQLVAKAFQDAISPTEQLQLKIQELKIAFEKMPDDLRNSAQAQAAYNAEVSKLEEEAAKADDRLKKLLERTDSFSAGAKAALIELGDEAKAGKFAEAFSTEAIHGFEDNTIRMLEGLKVKWSDYFRSLETMALKFAMNKALTGLLSSIGLAAKLGIGAGGQDAATIANTSATQLNTAATQALTASMDSMGGSGGGGGGGGGEGGDEGEGGGGGGGLLGFIQALIPHAAGGDVTPGQGYLVGESGPEPFFPSVSGSILPSSALRGGDTHIHNYDFSNFRGDASLMEAVKAMVEARGQQAEQRAVVQTHERARRTTSGI